MNESYAFKLAQAAVIRDGELSMDDTLEVLKALIKAENNAKIIEELKGVEEE